jgi:hypothetical protein
VVEKQFLVIILSDQHHKLNLQSFLIENFQHNIQGFVAGDS